MARQKHGVLRGAEFFGGDGFQETVSYDKAYAAYNNCHDSSAAALARMHASMCPCMDACAHARMHACTHSQN